MDSAVGQPRLSQPYRWRFLRTYLRNGPAVIGAMMMLVALVAALAAPLIAPFDPFAMAARPLMPPNAANWMGTDQLGRDILSRIVYGTRVSTGFAAGAAFLSFVVGTIFGALAGYFGGIVDHVMGRFLEFFMMIPFLILIILMSALLGANITIAGFVVGITIWPSNARIARAQVFTLKRRMFVRAARAAGASHMRTLFVHILPNGIQPLIVNSTLQVGTAILLEASLSFLGLGDPNYTSWGQMLREAQPYLAIRPTYSIFPGIAVGWLVVAATLVGDGINAALSRSAP